MLPGWQSSEVKQQFIESFQSPMGNPSWSKMSESEQEVIGTGECCWDSNINILSTYQKEGENFSKMLGYRDFSCELQGSLET